jgi:hypothetical protein
LRDRLLRFPVVKLFFVRAVFLVWVLCSEALHCGIVADEHLRRDHVLERVSRTDAGQGLDDQRAQLVALLDRERPFGLAECVVLPAIGRGLAGCFELAAGSSLAT